MNLDLLLPLFNARCQHRDCSGNSNVDNLKTEARCCHISWKCSNGHVGSWCSLFLLCNKGGKDFHTNSLLLAIGILVSGNNFDKLNLFCKFLNLSLISRSTFMRLQRFYLIPEIKGFWQEMKNAIWQVLAEEPVVLCGDGRNDSSGHNAKYCTYVLMEEFLEVIVDVDVVDMRETGGISTNMEEFGLKRLLERLVGKIILSEIVTDASTSVTALVNLRNMVRYYTHWTFVTDLLNLQKNLQR